MHRQVAIGHQPARDAALHGDEEAVQRLVEGHDALHAPLQLAGELVAPAAEGGELARGVIVEVGPGQRPPHPLDGVLVATRGLAQHLDQLATPLEVKEHPVHARPLPVPAVSTTA